MYCQNCGTFNTDEAVFCESCGTKLEKAGIETPVVQTPVVQAPVAVPKKMSKLTMAMIVEVIALVLVVYGIYTIGKSSFSAEHVAENYFVNIVNGDWKAAYENLDLDETEFINQEMFIKANENNYFGQVNNYVVNDTDDSQIGDSELGTNVVIHYREKGSGFDERYEVVLSKQAGKKFLFFDDWRVSTDSLIYKDYYLEIPKGAKLVLDGVEVSDKYLNTQNSFESNYDSYVIPEIFKGTHTVEVTMENREDVTSVITTDSSYYLSSMRLKEEVMDELIQLAGSDMKQIYTALMGGKSFKTIEELFVSDEEIKSEIKEEYNDLLSKLNESRYVPHKIEFKNISGNVNDSTAAVDVSFDYDLDYTYEDWWSGEMKEQTYSGSAGFYFEFTNENGNWVLQNLGCEKLYY